MSLQAINLTAGYRAKPIVADVTLTARHGAVTTLVGANGSGKSTLLRTLTGAQQPLAGKALINGCPIADLSAAARARLISVVFTDRSGGGGLTVSQLVAIGRHPYSGFLGRLTPDDRHAVAAALESVGLSHKSGDFVASLSDGERQKAMIARAIAQQAPVMVLDEPTSFLDVSARFEIMALLRDIADSGTTVILSTHDIAPALAVSDDIWAIVNRHLIAGTRDNIIADGTLNSVYHGATFDPTTLDFKPL
ncbi:MAG: ABC transporter ATP-binding protein [Muribaculaceae bacterium]